MPLWNRRWIVNTRVEHQHPGSPSHIESRQSTPYSAELISSERHSISGGHHGLIQRIPAANSQNVGRWEVARNT